MSRWPQVLLLFWIAAALLGLWPGLQPDAIQLGRILALPHAQAWLGHDDLGRNILARLLAGREGAEDLPLSQLLAGDRGRGIVDPETHHTVLPVLIARVINGAFHPVKRLEAVAGDPYLTRGRSVPAPALRVVS